MNTSPSSPRSWSEKAALHLDEAIVRIERRLDRDKHKPNDSSPRRAGPAPNPDPAAAAEARIRTRDPAAPHPPPAHPAEEATTKRGWLTHSFYACGAALRDGKGWDSATEECCCCMAWSAFRHWKPFKKKDGRRAYATDTGEKHNEHHPVEKVPDVAPEIKNVALAGARGNIGAPTLRALLDHGFHVTVLTRLQPADSTPAPFPSGVVVRGVDYGDREGLTAALKGMHAVIDATFSSDGGSVSKNLAEAAADAGVYRFIPSEFGLDPESAALRAMPVFFGQNATYRRLRGLAEEGRITYTAVACGPVLEWSLATGFTGVHVRGRKLKWMDGGTNIVPCTTLEWVGKATARVLTKPEETKNRVVYIKNVEMSQRDLARAAKDVLGETGWTEETLHSKTIRQTALNEFKAGNYSFHVFANMIKCAYASPECGNAWKDSHDNELLGVPELSNQDVKNLIKEIVDNKNGVPELF